MTGGVRPTPEQSGTRGGCGSTSPSGRRQARGGRRPRGQGRRCARRSPGCLRGAAAERPDRRRHTLEILMHSPRQLTDDTPPAASPAVEDGTSLPQGQPRRWFLTAFASGTGVKNHGSGNQRSSTTRADEFLHDLVRPTDRASSLRARATFSAQTRPRHVDPWARRRRRDGLLDRWPCWRLRPVEPAATPRDLLARRFARGGRSATPRQHIPKRTRATRRRDGLGPSNSLADPSNADDSGHAACDGSGRAACGRWVGVVSGEGVSVGGRSRRAPRLRRWRR